MLPWRLIKSPPSNAFMNMAVDEAILKMVEAAKSTPTVRFYAWDPPAVSVGYFQDSLKDVDIPACREMGMDIVKRLTGGRAVLHDRELTYSVICPESDPHFPDNILGTYKVISSCLVKGLNFLGLDASLTPSAKRRGRDAPSACFSSPSHYEITISGKKLIGSAQKRGDGAFLQHGSILTDFQRGRLARSLRAGGNLDGVAYLGEYMDVDIGRVVECLIRGFEEGLGIRLEEGSLTVEETALAERLAEEKYASREWNFMKQL